ncbi:hypothetical protein [Dactylosporangium sp. NPDC005555]|uniref:DUF6892 domain-containing protein n=1 Tax=Dactylosporangium sp. NPDC005555 TaxID=3154889 RepID=UPI0033AB9D85
MDDCLRLALLECDFSSPVLAFARLRPAERQARYGELRDVTVAADVDGARWTGGAVLRGAVPDGTDATIRSLDGIAAFPELRVLDLPEAAVEDLVPLTGLPALALLSLGVTASADLGPLLSCAGLTRVDISCGDGVPVAAQRDVLVALADRGVHVDQLLPAADGAPFADPVLKLAVLDLLGVPLPTAEPFDEYHLDDGNLARVLGVALTQEQLDSVEHLHWAGGGYTVQHVVWPQWDGETGEFDIRSLRGIEALRNLRRLEIAPLDLIPADEIAALHARGVEVSDLYG